MRILDKYIIKELLGPFIFGICAFCSVFIGSSTLFRIAQYITEYGASISAVTKLFIFSLPGIIVLTFPMSMLLATLLAFGRLSSSSEITAMKSGGISFLRLATPVFIVAFVVSLFTVAFNEIVVPRANTAYQDTLEYEIKNNMAARSQKHLVIKDVKNGSMERLIYVREFDAETNIMRGISIQEFENEQLLRMESAAHAKWSIDKWTMYDGIVYSFDDDGTERTMTFKEQLMPVKKTPKQVSREQKEPKEMTIRELKQQIKVLKKEFVPTGEFELEMHQRFAIPMACFVFALIGTPLGMQPQRKSSALGFGISVAIIFMYYAIMMISGALGKGAVIPPMLAAWTPNLICMLAGAYLIHRASK
ncbi:MAG: LPS export ABC transporter permease LptG [Selenomonadales bacterium]|nr:LPS export ABC transporter permease LptG [Selenomonadales bacterium]